MAEEEFLSEREKTSKVFELENQFGLKFKDVQQFEFFFYAANEDNASNLAIELYELKYEVEPVTKSATGGEWLINGWTKAMAADEKTIGDWSTQMGELALKHHSRFDGWGSFTNEGKPA